MRGAAGSLDCVFPYSDADGTEPNSAARQMRLDLDDAETAALRVGRLLFKTICESLEPGSQGQKLILAADVVSQLGRR